MRHPTDGTDFSSNLDRHALAHQDPHRPELGSLPDAPSVDEDIVEQLKTGTTTVGIATDDGVVLATDQQASIGRMISNKNVQKVEPIHPTGAITIAGSVSAAQSLVRTLKAEVNLYEARRGEHMSMQALSTLMSNLLRSGAFLIVSPILGGVDSEGSHVYSIDPLGSTLKDDFTVSGSGSQFALGVLEQEYDDSLSTEEARVVAARAVQSATERDVSSGYGCHVAEITDEGVEVDEYDDIADAL